MICVLSLSGFENKLSPLICFSELYKNRENYTLNNS